MRALNSWTGLELKTIWKIVARSQWHGLFTYLLTYLITHSMVQDII
jgi:hypothetical protein